MSSIKAWKKLVHQLRRLLESLPPREERDELVRAINEIVDMLSQVSSSLSSLPASEEASEARKVLEKLEFILNRNPLLRDISFKAKPKRISKVSPLIQISREEVLHEIEVLSKLSKEELRIHLSQDIRYSKKFLSLILSELGRSVPSKATKDQIIDEIVTAITTRRTYEGLRGDQNGMTSL
jgi:hypothetical protein